MKILFLADNFPPEKNAQASRVFERACYWVKWGHSVSVLTSFPNFPEGKLYPGFTNRWRDNTEMEGINVIRVKTFIAPNAGRIQRTIDFVSYMLSAIVFGARERRSDIVVASSPQFFAGIAGWVLSVCHRVPFVLEVSDLCSDSIVAVGAMRQGLAVRCLEKVESFLYSRAARIVVLTTAFKRSLVRRGVPECKIDVVINGVDLPRFSPRPKDVKLAADWGLSPNDFVIGYLGTLGMAHGLDNVLQAAALAKNPAIRYLLVGAGAEQRQLVARAQEMALTNIVFVAAQPKERMTAFWSICDLALVHLKNTPLFSTVIPSKMFEAMAMGLPILLACPEGEASAIVRSEDCGLVVAAQNPAALAAAVEFLATEPDAVRRFSQRSLGAARRYSREKQARDMIAALERAAGADAGVPAKTRAATGSGF